MILQQWLTGQLIAIQLEYFLILLVSHCYFIEQRYYRNTIEDCLHAAERLSSRTF
ncbi:hypothetical protein D515_04185 [Grimontia indica]|uniref:Uncharacterized protein n=1 Tax=Grimontia indica TaxID=1056512 RepID=R1GYV4_9GAMM|nr:hypothetical protein D515_04185 [Grimontia indica]